MENIPVRIIQLAHAAGLPLPRYATEHSAGCDVLAAIDTPLTLPGCTQGVIHRTVIPAGIAIALPPGYEAQIRPRSGLAAQGIAIPNAPGTIDADYRGEIKVLLANLGEAAFLIERGMRIAQLIIAPIIQVDWQLVEQLDETARGANGFGSTGLHAHKISAG